MFDSDLTTPAHDALMVWLDGYIDQFIAERHPTEWEMGSVQALQTEIINRIEDRKARLTSYIDSVAKGQQVARDPDSLAVHLKKVSAWRFQPIPQRVPRIKSKVWQSPILASDATVVGFVDMRVAISYAYALSYWWPGDELIFTNDHLAEWKVEWQDEVYLFEVKTAIPSVGDLIRQVRLHQEYEHGTYIIVSPDDKYAEILKGQGIGFMKAPSTDSMA